MRGVRVERARNFGEAFLGLALWRRLRLQTLIESLIEAGEEDVPWATVASVLTVARFCAHPAQKEKLCAHLMERSVNQWRPVHVVLVVLDQLPGAVGHV